ncbi:MAG: O-antigen ligase family protein [Thermosulfidibacteraceae bacterium]
MYQTILAIILILHILSIMNPNNIDYLGSIKSTIKIIIVTLFAIYLKTKHDYDKIFLYTSIPFIIVSFISTLVSFKNLTISDISGIYDNRNDFGLILAVSIGSLMVVEKKNKWQKLAYNLLGLLFLTVLILGGSRGSTLSVLIVLFLYFIVSLNNNKKLTYKEGVMILSLLVIPGMIFMLEPLKSRFLNLQKDESIKDRIELIRACLDETIKNPLGHCASDKVYYRVKPEKLPKDLQSHFRNGGCHFTMLDAGLKFGILGTIAWISIGLILTLKFIRTLKERQKDKIYWIILILFLNSFTENYLQFSRLMRLVIFILTGI